MAAIKIGNFYFQEWGGDKKNLFIACKTNGNFNYTYKSAKEIANKIGGKVVEVELSGYCLKNKLGVMLQKSHLAKAPYFSEFGFTKNNRFALVFKTEKEADNQIKIMFEAGIQGFFMEQIYKESEYRPKEDEK